MIKILREEFNNTLVRPF